MSVTFRGGLALRLDYYRRMPSAILVLLALVLGWAPPPRGAPTSDEQKAFSEGLSRFDAGDARGAERSWKAGYAIRRDPAFLVRIGEAQEKAGDPKAARDSYERYLRESPDAADRADIEARLRRLGVTSAGPGTTSAGTSAGTSAPASTEEPGDFGGDRAPSAPSVTSPVTEPMTESSPKPMSTPPSAPPVADPASSANARGAHASATTQASDASDPTQELRAFTEGDAERPRSTLSTLAWSGLGLTAVLAGAALFFGAKASEAEGDVNRLVTYRDRQGAPLDYANVARQYDNAVDDGRRNERLSTVLGLTALGTAVAATTLFIIDGRRAPAETHAAGPRPTSFSARLRGRVATLDWNF